MLWATVVLKTVRNWLCINFSTFGSAGADPEIFQRGVEEENFERKMSDDTRTMYQRVYT